MLNDQLYACVAYWSADHSFRMENLKFEEEDSMGLFHPYVPLPPTTYEPPTHAVIRDYKIPFVIPTFRTGARISLDAKSLNRFAIAYEVEDEGIYLRGYRVEAAPPPAILPQVLRSGTDNTAPRFLPDFKIPGSENGRFPDIALCSDMNGGTTYAYVTYLDTANAQIKTYRVAFGELFAPFGMGGMPNFVLEHTEFISGYSVDIDAFQLHMDVPDNFNPFGGYPFSN